MHGGRAPPHPRRRTPARRAGGAVRSRCVWGRGGGKAPCLNKRNNKVRAGGARLRRLPPAATAALTLGPHPRR